MSRNEAEIRTKSPESLRLGALWFDPAARELRKADGTVVDLRRQSVDVLNCLAARPSETVEKDDLVSAVWSGVAVTDDSLVQCIGDIRRALGPEGRDCIRTVRRRGYRLVPSDPEAPTADTGLRDWWRAAAIAALCAALLTAVVAYLALSGNTGVAEKLAPPGRPIVAVLPFANLTQNPDQQYFIDGLTEDITTDLARMSGLRMISSASAFAVRDLDATPVETARELGADFVVTGSVRRDNRRVRVTATLTDTSTNETVWADRYDRDIGGIFDLQDDVSRSVAASLAIQLSRDEQALFDRQQTVNSDAYDLLLRGLGPLRTFTEEGIEEARGYFRKAIEADPGYARAHANLALTYGTSIMFRLGEQRDFDDVAVREAELAVSLDPKLPQAQFALAVVQLARGNHDAAISAAREAIRLEPSYADGYAVLAQTLAFGGDKAEALAAIGTAKKLSPRYTFAYLWVEGHILLQLRRYEEARAILEDVVSRNAAMVLGWLTLAATYGHLGLAEEAEWLEMELLTLSPDLSAFEEGNALPYRLEADRAHYVEGLLLAGIPE